MALFHEWPCSHVILSPSRHPERSEGSPKNGTEGDPSLRSG